MYPNTTIENRHKIFSTLFLVLFLLLLGMIGTTISSYLQVKNSGTLVVTSDNHDSLITISEVNKAAEAIGEGQTKVRLKPGSYLVGVARQGRVSFQSATITKGAVTTVNLNADSTPLLPSAGDINFQGSDELIARGLTTEQVAALREAIFQFDKTVKSAVVQPGSVVSGPYDPNSDNPSVSRNFTLILDGQPYAATTSWIQADTASLTLTNQAGQVVFDSASGHD